MDPYPSIYNPEKKKYVPKFGAVINDNNIDHSKLKTPFSYYLGI
jgi:hypothetical protein